jgi:hypothetical protein
VAYAESVASAIIESAMAKWRHREINGEERNNGGNGGGKYLVAAKKINVENISGVKCNVAMAK